MPRSSIADDLMFVGHIVDMARTLQRLATGANRTDLDTDEKLKLALARALQVIGERLRGEYPATSNERIPSCH